MDTPSLPPTTPPQQSSNTGKIILIVAAAVVGLCLIACIAGFLIFRAVGQRVGASVESSPQEVSETADAIASFDLPSGFEPRTAFNLLGFNFVVYEGPTNNEGIVIIQMPVESEMNDATIEQMREQLERQSGRSLGNLETIDEYDTTIRGEPGRVILQEGETDNGVTFRQMLVVFQGKGGLAMMSIFGRADTWDQAQYNALVESIR